MVLSASLLWLVSTAHAFDRTGPFAMTLEVCLFGSPCRTAAPHTRPLSMTPRGMDALKVWGDVRHSGALVGRYWVDLDTPDQLVAMELWTPGHEHHLKTLYRDSARCMSGPVWRCPNADCESWRDYYYYDRVGYWRGCIL